MNNLQLSDVGYQVSHDNHYNLMIHLINGDNILIAPHHIEENLEAIDKLLLQDRPYYIYEVKGLQTYRPTFFTARKLRMLHQALQKATKQQSA